MTVVSKTGTLMVELRAFYQNQEMTSVYDIPVCAYLPVFLTGEQNVENIVKRITLMYFKKPSEISKIFWSVRGEEGLSGEVVSPFL